MVTVEKAQWTEHMLCSPGTPTSDPGTMDGQSSDLVSLVNMYLF